MTINYDIQGISACESFLALELLLVTEDSKH